MLSLAHPAENKKGLRVDTMIALFLSFEFFTEYVTERWEDSRH